MNPTPDLLTTISRLTVYGAALLYESAGFSVLPCRGKEPALSSWKQLQDLPAGPRMIELWERAGLLSNVGVVCGRASMNLVVVDCDGPTAVNAYTARFRPVLTDTYTVQSGSGLGAHFYYFVDALPPTTRLVNAKFGGNVELRADGCYVVAPPSLHPKSGKLYTIQNDAPILRVPHLRGVVEWIKTEMAEKRGGALTPLAGKYQPVRNASAYGRAALAGETARVRSATQGNQNNTLNLAAFQLGQLVAKGHLDRGQVETELVAAAASLVQRDGEESVRRTIKSGLDAGIAIPPTARSRNT